MMRFLMVVLTATLLTAGAPARAEGPVTMAVVDIQQILSESAAAKSILDQLKTHRQKLDKEVKGIEESLKKEEQTLVKQRETAKPEDFAKSRKEFEKKLLTNREKVQKQRRAADQAFNKAVAELRGHILTVTDALATERKIQLVMTKQNIILSDRSLDITADVMAKLNDKVKTIKVTIE